jgi:hypothetical protein
MKNHEFFNKIIPLLQSRHIYSHVLWSYGVYHNEPEVIREYLSHSPLIDQVGKYLVSSLINIDPVIRKNYQHMEYSPLVNPRAHKLAKKRVILNERFYQQYERLMKVLSFKPQLDDGDFMDITYYMLLQDRIEKAIKFFNLVNPQKLNTILQYDYFQAYLEFYKENSGRAKQIASMYKDYPVPRWRNLFKNVLNQVEEIEGKTPEAVDREDRTQVQTKLTSSEPGFDFSVEDKRVTINYQNINEIQVNYYLMDIELLFSRNPFVQKYASQFSYIKPNGSEIIKLPVGKKAFTFNLPERFHNSNVLTEITSEGIKKTQAYYSHSLVIQIVENYGQIIISHQLTGKPLPGVYVKVYAQMQGEGNKFYKDGYTDLRGRFDYTSLNTDEIDRVKRYSILVVSESYGAVIKEAAPPKQ